jgi:putative flippase GtrA
VPPVTILTALGVWYGYELSLARGRYFGLDPTVIAFSTREYILRSVVAVLGPMLVLLVVVAALLSCHLLVRWTFEQHARARRLRAAAQAVGAGLVVLGVALIVEGIRAVRSAAVLPEYPIARCLLVGAGMVAVTYGLWLVDRAMAPIRQATSPPRPQGRPGAIEGLARQWQFAVVGVTAGAVTVSLFWAFSVAAENRGTSDAAYLYESGFRDLPRVVVYSSTPLAIEGEGVSEIALNDPGSSFRWRYSGLRLLVRSEDRYFMVPAGWQPEGGTVVVLDEVPELRFEFLAPEGLLPASLGSRQPARS